MQSQVEIKTILNIPANSNILSVGTFMFVRGVGGLTEKDASMLNSVLDKLSVDGCKVLGSILMSYARQTKEVIAFNRDNEKSNVINFESRKFATSNPSYSSYILTTTMRSMSLLTALSYEKSSRGGNNLVFSYKDGVTTINIENENVNVKDAPKKVEQTLRNMGEKVVVKSESRLEKYANANMSSEYVTEFLRTEDKSIEGVPLVEQGMMIRTGIFEGKYGVSKAAPKNMSNAVSAHLVSDGKELKAFFTTKSGINKTGTSLPNSHVFFKDGMDVDGVGIKKGLAQSIIKENDMDINCGQKEAEAAFRIYLDDKNPDMSKKLLYNPSWAAKDLADAKKNSGGLDSFTAKYRNVLNKIPVYTGAKGLKYILIPYTSSLSVSLFTKLPNVVEKLIAYYVMSASVVRVGGFKSFVESFFRFNVKEAMRKLVMISLQYLFNDYDIVVELQGIKKTAQDIWAELDGDNKGMVDNVILDEVDMDWNLDGALTFDKKEEYYNPYKYMDDVGQRHKISIAPSAKGGQHYNDGKINIEIDDDEEINSEISESQLKARKDAESDMQKYEGFYVDGVLGEDMINSRYSRKDWDGLFLRKLCVNVFGEKWAVDNAVVYLNPLSVVSKYSEVMEFNEIVVGFVKGCEMWKVYGSKSKSWCEKVSDLYISYFDDVNWGD